MDTTSTSRRPWAFHSACPPSARPTGTRPHGDLLASFHCRACPRSLRILQGSWPPSLPTWAPRIPWVWWDPRMAEAPATLLEDVRCVVLGLLFIYGIIYLIYFFIFLTWDNKESERRIRVSLCVWGRKWESASASLLVPPLPATLWDGPSLSAPLPQLTLCLAPLRCPQRLWTTLALWQDSICYSSLTPSLTPTTCLCCGTISLG